MTIRRAKAPAKIVIDLDGPQGNAHVLMGYASTLAKRMGLNKKKIIGDMMLGDYLNLLRVFDQNFGDVVELVTTNEEYIDYVRTGRR
jgi:hypothetical protein